VLAKEREESRRPDSGAELTAGKPARRRLPARNEARHRIEIERQADDVFKHGLAVSSESRSSLVEDSFAARVLSGDENTDDDYSRRHSGPMGTEQSDSLRDASHAAGGWCSRSIEHV
jgi:hypothetical protein